MQNKRIGIRKAGKKGVGAAKGGRPDYSVYTMGRMELLEYAVLYLGLSALVGWLFFGMFRFGLFFIPGLPFFIRYIRKKKAEMMRSELGRQFRDALELLAISLKAGYSVEHAFFDAAKELGKLHGENAPITEEFVLICRQIRLHIPIEELLEDFAKRSDIEEIQNFAAVFTAAKRMGGSLPQIIRTASETIGGRLEVEREIEAVLAAKKFEQRVMAVMPCAIILYMRIGSPDFLAVLYDNMLGHLIMLAALAVYAAAVYWGMKIVEIRV